MLSKFIENMVRFYSEVRRVELDANQVTPSSCKIKNNCTLISFPHKPLWNGA